MTKESPSHAIDVANWFVQKSWGHPATPPCDLMKINKLVYYAHGWYLGNGKGPLFPEDVEAWRHGPVIREVYQEFIWAGRNAIDKLGRRLVNGDKGFVTEIPKEKIIPFLERIWEVYGDKSAIRLSNMTHRPGEPWTVVHDHYDGNLSSKPRIPNEIMEECFAKKLTTK